MKYEVVVKNSTGKIIERHLFDSYRKAISRMDDLEEKYWGKHFCELIDYSQDHVEKVNRYGLAHG